MGSLITLRRGAPLLGWLLLAGTISASEPQRVILDTCPLGDYDDLVAIAVSALSPELDLMGVVVSCEPFDTNEEAVARLLRVIGREDIGIYRRLAATAPRPDFPYWSQFPRRRWGLWPELDRFAEGQVREGPPASATDFYVHSVTEHPGEVTIMVTSSLTTLAESMRVADGESIGRAYRESIRQVFFSGGDFDTSEYNVYIDVPAARMVFESGVPLYQFGGEDPGKAYFRHRDRARLWKARTPLSAALEDLYHDFRAGYDPTSPFVPILYDVHLPAYLIEGDTICRFAPMSVGVAPDGHLVHTTGPPNVESRVANRGDRLIAFVLQRLCDPVPAALNHLRNLDSLIAAHPGGAGADLRRAVAAVIRDARWRGEDRSGRLRRELDALGQGISGHLGRDEDGARRHIELARGFLLRESRAPFWGDPYTRTVITLYLFVVRMARWIVAILVVAVCAWCLLVVSRRVRRSRKEV